MNFEIFASYSHRDTRFVKPLLKFLQPTGVPVFRDEDAIIPGKKWAVVIASAIKDCRLLYLFWCNHSAASAEVRKEYEQALALNKDVVPVLLDDTPLPGILAEYQWVDLRSVLGEHEQVIEQKVKHEERQEPSRNDHDMRNYKRGRDSSASRESARKGHSFEENYNNRTITVDKDIPIEALKHAGEMLFEDLSARLHK